jgi:parafibromin
LEKGTFIPTEEKKKSNPKKEKIVVVRHTHEKQLEEYHVIDNPEKLSKSDWDRVVAVFTNGQTWEFKGWFSENPTQIFTRYKGFHAAYDDQQVHENIKKWPVKVLRIGRAAIKRHTDQTVVREFWKVLHE